MKYFIKYFFISILISFIQIAAPSRILAQEENASLYSRLREAMDSDNNGVYTSYSNFSEKINKEGYQITETDLTEFQNLNRNWNTEFLKSKSFYGQYIANPDPKIAEIATVAQDSINKGILATEAYRNAFESNTDETLSSYMTSGDQMMLDSINTHDKAVDLYNNYSGASTNVLTKNGLVISSIIASMFSLVLFIKSRKKSQLEAEKIRSEVYKALFTSSLWMTVGIVVTTVGLSYALEKGGTYYILYGPILFGGWKLLKGLYSYFTDGRKALDYINSTQKGEAIKESYSFRSGPEDKTPEYVCQYCGFKHTKKSVICKNCGENIL